MSYILDALKKAERERDIARVPSLMTVHESRIPVPHKRFWAVLACALLCAAALAWYAASSLKTRVGAPPQAISAEKHETVPEEIREKPTELPIPAAVSSGTGNSRKAAAVTPGAPVAETAGAGTSIRKHAAESVRAESQQDESSAPVSRGSVQQQAASRNNAAPEEAEQAEGAGRPASLQEAMAKMNITVLVYAENPAERMVFINNQKYLEGDYVDGLYPLESITPDGVVLTYKGQKAQLRPKSK